MQPSGVRNFVLLLVKINIKTIAQPQLSCEQIHLHHIGFKCLDYLVGIIICEQLYDIGMQKN